MRAPRLSRSRAPLLYFVMHPAKDHGTHDELDALTSALVGYFYLAGSYEAIGNAMEGYPILPDPSGIPAG